MTRTSKASSAGSNSGRGTGLGSLGRSNWALGVLALALVALAIPSFALAAETRLPVESFGSDGTSGSGFSFPEALAFDQGNKDLYVLEQGNALIHGFDASTPGTRTPLGGNFPLSAPGSSPFLIDDLAVDQSSHGLYYLSEAHAFSAEPSLYAFEANGTERAGNFPIAGYRIPCGAGVDPSGDVWVADLGAELVKEYDSDGNQIGTVHTFGQGLPCHLAFDSDSNLYVSMFEGNGGGGVWKYTTASDYASATLVDSVVGAFPAQSPAITVDRSNDELYVAHAKHVSVFSSSGAFLYEFGGDVSGAGYTGIAIDESADRVYVSDFEHETVHVFGQPILPPDAISEDAEPVTDVTATLNGTVNPRGNQLSDCHFEYGTSTSYGESAPCEPAAGSIPADSAKHAVKAEISGLTPGTTYHFRLVDENVEGTTNGLDRSFTTAIEAPTISAQTVETVETVGSTDVNLSAKINPKGAPTTYLVEYGTTTAYGQSTAQSAPFGFGGDDNNHTVNVHIGGLKAGTAYHFRFVATNVVGSTQGPDVSFATYPSTSAPGSCSNDEFRTGFGGSLPDCRAYEQATPVDKNGANVQGTVNAVETSPAGDRVTFSINGGLPSTGGSSTLSSYMASRGGNGWSSDGLLAPTEPGFTSFLLGWSEDLSTTADLAPSPGNTGTEIYLRDSATAAYQPTFSYPGNIEASVGGYAADTSHLTFETEAQLLPDAASGKTNLYDLDHGNLTLAGRIPVGAATSCDDASGPACEPAPKGSVAGPYNWEATVCGPQEFSGGIEGGASCHYYTQNTISRNGSKVFFTAGGADQLYVREDGTRTTQVSASQRTVPDPNGEKPAAFVAATPDGSKVFFMSCEKLTDDSTAVSTSAHSCIETEFGKSKQGQDLYSYDTESGDLTDLTVDSNGSDELGAGVQGFVGASEDGSYVYFVANGVLAPGASPGECRFGEPNICNLYVEHDRTVTYIANLLRRGDDGNDWTATNVSNDFRPKSSRVSPDGRTLLFSSKASLTGYDNAAPAENACGAFFTSCDELFHYSAPSEELSCISCNPTGTAPKGNAVLGTVRTVLFSPPRSTFLTRNLSADGNEVFFDSKDALLPKDTNGVSDVYEWEAKGSGSCESESQNGGCLYLLSSGTSPNPSYFGDASANGDDAFFFTSQGLVPTDRDALVDIYDASTGGGLASQHTLTPPTCSGTACQANPAPPPDQGTSSAVFSGPGNAKKPPSARKCPKGKQKVRRAGRVSCKKASRHKQSKSKRHSNRGGSK